MPATTGKSQVVSGAYKCTYEGLDMGLSQEGFTLNTRVSGQNIKADIAGEAIIDSLYRGIEMSISFTLNNWNAEAVQHLLWWFGDTQDFAVPDTPTRVRGRWGSTERVGLSAWDYAKPLELISCALAGAPDYAVADDLAGADSYTKLQTITPEAMIFPRALLRQDEQYSLLFSSMARYVTLTLDIFPVKYIVDPQAEITEGKYYRITDCDKMTYFVAQFPVDGEPTGVTPP